MRSFDWMVGVCAIVAVGCGGRVTDGGNSDGLSGAGAAAGASSSSGGPGSTTNPGSATTPGTSSATGAAGSSNNSNPSGTTVSPPPSTGIGPTGAGGYPPFAGGPPNPPPTGSTGGAAIGEVDGGPIYYTLGGVTPDGHLLAAYWTGSEERTVLIDPQTGATTFAGNLCDLYLWESQFTYDEPKGLAYAVGDDRAGKTHVYTLSLATKTCTSVAFSNADPDGGVFHYIFAGVSPDGRIVAAHWDGKAEATVLIDPATGASSFVGNMGDLYMWQGQFAYDDAKNAAYAIGEDVAGATHLYSLSLSTGVSSRVDVDPIEIDGGANTNYVFGGTTPDGHIVAAYWNGAVEQTVLIDPATGRTSVVGHLGDLYMWQGQLLYGKHTGVVYAIGQDRAGTKHFYLLPLER